MSRFFIKQISVTGEKVLFSEVSFNDGVNIIYGPSNAGKSYIINCINFMFAGDPPFTKSSTGYDTVTMTMESDDGYAISMTRKIIDGKNGEVGENSVEVISNYPNVESGPYSIKGIFANNIYVRLQDSNTPVDKSADFHHVEYLWKKRFGMLLSPIEKVKLYLKYPEHWANSPSSEDKKYYKYAPEFTIDHTYEPEDGRDGYEYYLFAQTDSRPHWSEIRICYHQTVLAELGGVILDGGRYFTTTPDRDGISLTEYHNWDVPYRYMVKGNLNHLVHEFYYVDDGDEARHSHNEYEGCILIFEDEKEHQRFKIYVRKNWDRKDEFVNDIWIPHMEQLPGYNMDAFREEYLNVQILRRMLEEFRENGNTKN